MKKIMTLIAVATAAAGVFAGPCGGGGRGCGGGWCRPCGPRPCGPGWGHCPPPHCPGPGWGRGGCNFWPGFVGGVVGSLTYNTLVEPCRRETVVVQSTPTVVTQPVVVQSTPTVVTQPVVVQSAPTVVTQTPTVSTAVTQTQNVWVEGRYVDQVQSNGTVVRVWNPGHYETRSVVIQ